MWCRQAGATGERRLQAQIDVRASAGLEETLWDRLKPASNYVARNGDTARKKACATPERPNSRLPAYVWGSNTTL